LAGFGLLAVAVLIELAYQWFYFKNYFYDITGNGLVIRKGVISSWDITLPPHKVQDVYLDQDLFDRIFGLYDLHLSSATDVSQREAHIDGVGKDDAEALRVMVLSWASKEAPPSSSEKPFEVMKPESIGMYATLFTNILVLFVFCLAVLGIFGLVLFIVLFPFVAILSYLDFKVMRYELRREGVFVRTGYLLPKESIFLYRNIQDVEERRGILDMIFGVRTLTVKTMTTASVSNANLRFISEGDAQRVRTKILELRSQAAEVKAPGIVSDTERRAIASAAMRYAPKAVLPLKKRAVKQEWKEVEKPFPYHFLKAAHFSNAYTFVWLVAIGAIMLLSVLLVPGLVFLLLLATLAIPMFIFVAVIVYVNAIIADMSYAYTLYGDRVMIKYQFIALNKRELPFTKVQDIEKHVSFPNSFAHLADIKFETGAKEMLQQGRSSRVGSASMYVEAVPALIDSDAEKLKQMIGERMGLDLSGLGIDPLVKRFPLEKIKPIKKTCGWAIWLFVLFAIAAPLCIIISQFLLIILLAFIELAILAAKYVYECEYYKRYLYDMNDDVLVIKKGVFGSRELTIPLEKIQDVFINRDLLDLVFGLYDVYVSTATSRSIMNAHIDGVRAENAESLALLLIKKISEKR
jgi:membrane protein YdbS with pleckstrin-like domain